MKTTRRRFILYTGAGGLGLLAAACTPGAPATTSPTGPAARRVPTGELKIGTGTKVPSLDPHGAQSVEVATHTLVQHVMEPLVKRDPSTAKLVPWLATEWKTPDPKTWVFTLRNASYTDGSKLTSADVKASVERVIALKGALAPQFAKVVSIDTPDDSTVRITTSDPVGTLVSNMALVPIAPAKQIGQSDFFNKPIGTGPFKVTSWSPGADLRLESNDAYWGDAPGVKSIVFRYYPEDTPRLTAIETGEVDITGGIPPDQLARLKNSAEITINSIPGYSYNFIWMNSSRDVFKDKRVRQAMVYALDMDKMVKDLLPGVAERAKAPIPSTVFGYAPQTPYAYDPNKAKALLAEAGVPNGFEAGVIWNPTSSQLREMLAAMISYWNAIGVRVKSQEMERAIWIENLNKLNWDMDWQGNTVSTGDADFTLGRLYHSRANRNGYKNPELDKILDDAAATVDQDRRKDLYAQACKIIWEEAPGLFPADSLEVFAFRKRVSGFSAVPGIPYYANVRLQ